MSAIMFDEPALGNNQITSNLKRQKIKYNETYLTKNHVKQ